ncbi:cupin [Streptomyces sp. NPDC048523]|uniref:cupin n=1 Tax=unclassified Streptomyces TaxID=2593676 RepID=UPI003326DB5D
MSIPYLAQREDQQQFEWIGGSVFSVLLDAEATGGQLTVGRFDVSKGEAPPIHVHNNEDEVFLLLSVRRWCGPVTRSTSDGSSASSSCPPDPPRLPHHLREGGPPAHRDTPQGFEIPMQLLAEAAELSGDVVLGPPR